LEAIDAVRWEKQEHLAADEASSHPGRVERCTKWRTFPDKTEGAVDVGGVVGFWDSVVLLLRQM